MLYSTYLQLTARQPGQLLDRRQKRQLAENYEVKKGGRT